MKKPQFALSSDQLELLLAFEQVKGLTALAEYIGRDPSVISRNLQKIAEDFPVLIKSNSRWELTPLGKEVNLSTKIYLESQNAILSSHVHDLKRKEPFRSDKALLMIINAQKGLLDSKLGGRSNLSAEKHILFLLQKWRTEKKPVLHVKHVSSDPQSRFYQEKSGCEFLDSLGPINDETVIEKRKSSAFADTELSEWLKMQSISTLVLVGFTANECIDSTARDAAELGLTVFVVGDATAMFDIQGPDGKIVEAERIHKLTLANIHHLYAKVLTIHSFV